MGSLGKAAHEAGVAVVTKVVGRGVADKLFVTTTGVGQRCGRPPRRPVPGTWRCSPGLAPPIRSPRHGPNRQHEVEPLAPV